MKTVLAILVFSLCLTACAIAPPATPTPTSAALQTTPAEAAPAPPPSETIPVIPTAIFLTPVGIPTGAEPSATVSISAEALAYLEAALDILQDRALNRNLVNWRQLRPAALRRAGSAQTAADTYQAIELALSSLGDGQSDLLPAEGVQRLQQGELDGQNTPPSARLLANGALIHLEAPGFSGSTLGGRAYAIELQRLIAEMDSYQPCGWVLDLRQNQGEALWPMLAGIGPLLGEGMAGLFVYPDGSQRGWFYAASKIWLEDEIQIDVMDEIVYYLPQALPLTVVLVGPGTARAGEALAIAFFNRLNARSFGQPTAGLTSAIETFTLADGAWLRLAVAVYADRTGRIFSGPVTPDETIPPGEPGDDPPLQEAVNWLMSQPECAGR